jgi:multidrug resistance efflux pump
MSPHEDTTAMTDGEGEDGEAPAKSGKETRDPVRTWTLRLLVLSLVILIAYLVFDRLTPYSSQARVHALVVPVAAEVSGTVVEVAVRRNQRVKAGALLFRIDPTQYELAVAGAEASLDAARESVGASEAGIPAAEANVRAAEASRQKAQQDAVRLRRIKEQDPGALSDRQLESAESTLTVAVEQLAAAEANLEQARQSLGRAGEENSRILQANAALEQARVNLARTTVNAPTDGVVTDVRVDRGNFAGAGAPQMTFVSTEDVWIQADLTENNLGNVDAGDRAGVIFDVYPGRVFEGSVRDLAYGVAVDTAPLGSLPTVDNDRQWLRDAQRFPVVVDFDMPAEDLSRLRVGAQASVIVYTSDNVMLRLLGSLYLRLASLFSYAY